MSRRLKLRSRGGCIECKRRKQKCDEVRPECGPCLRLKHDCQWLDELSPTELQAFEQRRRQGKKIELKDVVVRYDDANVRISFLLHSMFKGANTACLGTDGGALTVHTELQFANDTSSLTWNCLNAMAMVYWGSNRDRSMLSAGYKARGTSLARLADSMSRDLSGDLVAAVSLARLFETMLPGTKSQWVIHAEGLARLFLAMGPAAFRPPEMRRLLENNRWVMIMAASAMRKPYMLNSPEWNRIPWEDAPKDMLQHLLDIYGRYAGMHPVWDAGLEPPIHEIMQEMHDWRVAVDPEIRKSVRLWPHDEPAIAFTELHHAYSIALYNLMIIPLTRYLGKFPSPIEGPINKQPLLQDTLLPVGDLLSRATSAADEVAMIVPWILEPERRGAGALYLAGPLHVCHAFWKLVNPGRAAWSEQIIKEIDSSWNSLLLMELNTLRG